MKEKITYPLDEAIILNEMVAELERQFKRFNRDVLIQYVAMKVRLTKTGFNPIRVHKPKTTITKDTLKYWVACFLEKYQP